MDTNNCLLPHYIRDNNIVSTCYFIPNQVYRGNIIYEVIRVIDGIPLFLGEHLNRFFSSITATKIEVDITKIDVAKRIFALIDVNKLSTGNIRFQITLNESAKHIFMAWISPFFYPSTNQYENGVKLISLVQQRENPNIKKHNSNFKNTISKVLDKNDVYEVLLINNNGIITEGSKSNIFFVNNNSVVTPKTTQVLPGITRQMIMKIATDNLTEIQETDIKLLDISNYNAAFITGTSPKILPVSIINNNPFNIDNQIIKNLTYSYNQLTDNYISTFNRSLFN